jgi:predicted transcriptional regulator
MKQILIEIEPEVAEKLEQIAPGRSRRRSEFIRMAIRKALWELEETATAQAYRKDPDGDADAYVDPEVWEGGKAGKPKIGRRR